jgi:F-type H+-transporting ATPase subunit gamma
MERVAAARLRRAQAKAEQAIPYVKKLKGILENLASTDSSHPLFEQRPVKKTALVVISADKGLSGPYNSNILTAADKFLKKYSPQNIDVIIFGKKGIEYYRRKPWRIEREIPEWGGKITFPEVIKISNDLVQSFLVGQYDEIWLLYTHYISVMKNEIIIEKFLNIGRTVSDAKHLNSNYIFEPSSESIYSEILPRYCSTKLQAALNEAYASELASRIVAMQTASKNSENMITDLTLKRNKVRQESITKEIIEISVSA